MLNSLHTYCLVQNGCNIWNNTKHYKWSWNVLLSKITIFNIIFQWQCLVGAWPITANITSFSLLQLTCMLSDTSFSDASLSIIYGNSFIFVILYPCVCAAEVTILIWYILIIWTKLWPQIPSLIVSWITCVHSPLRVGMVGTNHTTYFLYSI